MWPALEHGCGKQTPSSRYFSTRICYICLISKCRGKLDLSLCMTSVLARKESTSFNSTCREDINSHLMALFEKCRCEEATSDYKTCLAAKFVQNLPILRGILFASNEVVHRPRSDSPLHFEIRST